MIGSERLRSSSRDGGTTLAELAVAMLVFGVFGAFLATTVLQAARLSRTSAVRENAAQTASVVMARVSKDLRTALPSESPTGEQVAFFTAGPADVVFNSSVEPAVLRRRLRTVAGGVQRGRQLPDAGAPLTRLTYTPDDPALIATTRFTPADHVVTASFRYQLRGSTAFIDTVSATSLKDVAAVEVKISVDPDGAGRQKPVVLENTVRPYNL